MVMDSSAAPAAPAGGDDGTDKRASVRRVPAKTASRRMSLTKTNSASWNETPASSSQAPTSPASTSSSQQSSPAPPPPASAPPAAAAPPPPPRPAAPPAPAATPVPPPPAPAAPPKPAAPPSEGGGNLPPKATGARANLLGSINALRKD